MADQLDQLYEQLCEHARETARWGAIAHLLQWDERTMMPSADAENRAEELTLLSAHIHARKTDPRLGELIERLEDSPLAADPLSDTGVTIRRQRRDRDRAMKLPAGLVEELSRTSVLGQQCWQQAREDDDFAAFQPVLEKTLRLKREEAEALGYEDQPYDALLDEFEPDAKTTEVAGVLRELRRELIPLVSALAASDRRPPSEILSRHYPRAAQEAFGREVAAAIGFDFQRGRLDVTAHPFCSGVGPNDCRITTRYDERAPGSALFGTLHEAGHGIYEQGLRADQWGLPLGQDVSLGIHESQSRLWENMVGRSRAFWEHFYPRAQGHHFPESLTGVPLDDFFFAVNEAKPTLIRVEADEVTYNLHILIRFELELELLEDRLPVAELPAAWNAKYRDYLGIEPPNNAQGVLQDVHWSGGAIGYFPTYSLGNLYAAHWFQAAADALGDLDEQFARGEFTPLRDWLRENIHRQGRRFSATELLQHVTGESLSSEPLMAHLRSKYGLLYQLGDLGTGA